MRELDEREKAMMQDLCKKARKPSGYLETVLSFQLFDPSDELKRDIADSLQFKGYIERTSKDYTLKLTPGGYDYCMKQAPGA
jgi:hypothetical protein